MPTGYTAKLCEEGQSFEEFVWSCARAMGALIHMRDDNMDAPIKRPEPSFDSVEHHRERLKESVAELARYKKIKDKQIVQELGTQNQKILREHEESVARRTATRARLLRMRIQVSDWSPPTEDHGGLKDFMLQQLDETIKFDGEIPEPPKLETDVAEWRRSRIEWAERDIDYHTKQKAGAEVRRGSRSGWIDQLEASVAIPSSLQPSE